MQRIYPPRVSSFGETNDPKADAVYMGVNEEAKQGVQRSPILERRSVYNFSAGPAMLPTEVLQQVQAEMLDWHGSGMSIMEVSHRGKEFSQVIEQAEADLRELLNIPNHYKILFLSGGATMQFSMVPLNLMGNSKTADYIATGQWSEKAIAEARRYGTVNIAAQTLKTPSIYIPTQEHWNLNPKAQYVHYTPNETIDGVEFHWTPKTGNVPLIADMSSTLLSRPLDIRQYGIIYAGAQKNIGPAGLTIVIIREDLLKSPMPETPLLYNYQLQADHKSLYNTPATFSIYLAGLVFAWLKKIGGLQVISDRNRRKAQKFYDYIDHSQIYRNPIHPDCRSWMNVPFSLPTPELDKQFLTEAHTLGLTNLAGHRLVGGMRASLYNAMPEAGVDALITFMKAFARKV